MSSAVRLALGCCIAGLRLTNEEFTAIEEVANPVSLINLVADVRMPHKINKRNNVSARRYSQSKTRLIHNVGCC
jgi:hypothetical protein